MNVALTRCCKGMVVVTDKSFLQGAGRSTLLGQLCLTWSRYHDACWIDSKAMLNNLGALPGLPAPAPSQPNGVHSQHLSGRTAMPPRNPPSQTRTQTRTHQDQVSPLAQATLSPNVVRALRIEQQRHTAALVAETRETMQYFPSLTDANHQRRGGNRGHGRAQWVATVVQRDLDEHDFPSLQPLATALDPTQSSRQRSRKGRR